MNRELVSVIIPTYNREKSIKRSVTSVLNQTYSNLECIVVDDFSTDKTAEIIQQMGDSRLRYLKLDKNYGPSIARNIGIKVSKGKYIAFEDSDDFWMNDKLEKQIRRMQNDNEIGLVYCGYSFIKDGKKTKIPSDKYDIDELEGYIFNSLWNSNKIGTPTILMRKKCIDICGGFTEQLYSLEDWEFVLKISDKFKIGYVNECLVCAEYSPNGVNEQWENQAESILYILNKYKNKGLSEEKVMIALFDRLSYISDDEKKRSWGRRLVPGMVSSMDIYSLILNESKMKHKYKIANQLIYQMSDLNKLKSFIYKYIDIDKEKFAIYGAGYVGIILARILKIIDISFVCIVDKNEIKIEDFIVLKPQMIDETIDKIIVTVLEKEDFNQIVSVLPQHVEIIDICDLLTYKK